MEKLSHILAKKNRPTITIEPQATLHTAALLLCEHHVGALPVVDDCMRLCGLITERDLLIKAANRTDLDQARVDAVMTTNLVVAVKDDDLTHAMNTMTEAHVRHLPVMSDGALAGIVSIGDVVDAIRIEDEVEIRYLNDYMQARW